MLKPAVLRLRTIQRLGSPCICVLLLAGCAGEGLHGLSGSVTYQGTPVKEGTIQLYATSPQSSGQENTPMGGAMIRDGAYEVPSAHGLPPGTYLVKISAPERIDNKDSNDSMNPFASRETIPSKYNSQSTLTVEIGERSGHSVDFELE